MYGLIIEGVKYMITEHFGQATLAQVISLTDMLDKEISTHDQYGEHLVPNMLRALSEITEMTPDQIGILSGRYFVRFLVCHGYGELMNVMGRRFSDFLKGLDNIHEYFRFSYPKIKPPSFYCSSENENGLVLHYRSRRKGYIAYVMGQLIELAKCFYNIELGAEVVKLRDKGRFTFATIHLKFDNAAVNSDKKLREKVQMLNEFLPVDTISFLQMFPFYIAFDKNLNILSAGTGILHLMPDLTGKKMPDVFDLQRPCIKFTAEGCLSHENCSFQLESLHPVFKRQNKQLTMKINDVTDFHVETENNEEKPEHQEEDGRLCYVTLRGPIVYLKNCATFLLLATCVVDGLDSMFRMGLFLNDYGDADCNREIIMASIQKNDHLKSLLNEEKKRSQVLSEMTREIRDAKKRAKTLLAQIMPIEVAATFLRQGRADVTQTFECATVAVVKVCDFPNILSNMTPPEVVSLLNTLFAYLDDIVEQHGCYKAEIVGESYMMSCGAPYAQNYDAEVMADACLHMLSKVKKSSIRAGSNATAKIKIGAYSGPCVGAMIGQHVPRYTFFGDGVSHALMMESYNKTAMTLQIGQPMKDRLEKQAKGLFNFKARGNIKIKGKGEFPAYEIVTKSGKPRNATNPVTKAEEVDSSSDRDEVLSDDHSRTNALSRMSIEGSRDGSPTSSPTGSLRSDVEHVATCQTLNNSLTAGVVTTSLPLQPLGFGYTERKFDERRFVERVESQSKLDEPEPRSPPTFHTNIEDDDIAPLTPTSPPTAAGDIPRQNSTTFVSRTSSVATDLGPNSPQLNHQNSYTSMAAGVDTGLHRNTSNLSIASVKEASPFGKVPEHTILPVVPQPKPPQKEEILVSEESDLDLPLPVKEKPKEKKKEDRWKSKRTQSTRQPTHQAHQHTENCRCEDIRRDSKLKTKVCTLM